MGELPQQADANLANLQRLHAELRTISEERMRALDRRNEVGRQLADAAATEAAVGGPEPGGGQAGQAQGGAGRAQQALQRQVPRRHPA